jgi:hypothetical protein
MSGFSEDARAVMLSALDDAAAYRREVGDWCDDCSKQPEGQECVQHDSDEATARAYDELAGRLETQVPAAAGINAGVVADVATAHQADEQYWPEPGETCTDPDHEHERVSDDAFRSGPAELSASARVDMARADFWARYREQQGARDGELTDVEAEMVPGGPLHGADAATIERVTGMQYPEAGSGFLAAAGWDEPLSSSGLAADGRPLEPSDYGYFEPTPYDAGMTDDAPETTPGPEVETAAPASWSLVQPVSEAEQKASGLIGGFPTIADRQAWQRSRGRAVLAEQELEAG